MGYENKTFAIVNAAWSAADAVRSTGTQHRDRGRVAFAFLFGPALQQETPVMLSFGALDIELHSLRSRVQLLEDLLELFGGDEVDIRAASGWNKEEDTPQDNIQPFHERDDCIQIFKIVASDRRIDLDRKINLASPTYRAQCPVVRTGYASESIVDFSSRSVKTNREPGQPALLSGAR